MNKKIIILFLITLTLTANALPAAGAPPSLQRDAFDSLEALLNDIEKTAPSAHNEINTLPKSAFEQQNANDEYLDELLASLEPHGESVPSKNSAQSFANRIRSSLTQGSNAHDVLAEGIRPLHFAAMRGYIDSIQILLDNSADVHAVDDKGWTPLHWAAYKSHQASVEKLLANGAAVNTTDQEGFTALHYAAHYGHNKCVITLLTANADISLRINTGPFAGLTPFELAFKNGHYETADLIDTEKFYAYTHP